LKFIGIDIAKDKHDIIIIDDLGVIIYDHFTITNDRKGYKKLHTVINSCTKSVEDIRIGMEVTGIYHENLRDFLIYNHYSVYCINPVLTSFSRKSTSPRRTKTDKIDAIAICRYLMNNFRILHPYTPSLYHLTELKQLARNYNDNKKYLSKTKDELKRLLQIIFPEFTTHFNPYSKWALSFLNDYPLPISYKGLHLNTLAERIGTHSNHLEQAALIKQLAKDSIGKSSELNTFLLKCTISNLLHYDSQNKGLKDIISKKMKLFPQIMSIPGIGPINGATILGETGDVSKFENKHQYTAFFGVDPVIHESGKYKLRRSSLSKRGSKYLRTAIFSASRVVCVGNLSKTNKYRSKYLAMMAKGDKHHNTVIFAIAKNLIHSIYKILRTNTFYDNNL